MPLVVLKIYLFSSNGHKFNFLCSGDDDDDDDDDDDVEREQMNLSRGRDSPPMDFDSDEETLLRMPAGSLSAEPGQCHPLYFTVILSCCTSPWVVSK